MRQYEQALADLRTRADADPELHAELMANPLEVVLRETGISSEQLVNQLSDAELAAVTGGGTAGPTAAKCPKCGFHSPAPELMVLHAYFVHGEKLP